MLDLLDLMLELPDLGACARPARLDVGVARPWSLCCDLLDLMLELPDVGVARPWSLCCDLFDLMLELPELGVLFCDLFGLMLELPELGVVLYVWVNHQVVPFDLPLALRGTEVLAGAVPNEALRLALR